MADPSDQRMTIEEFDKLFDGEIPMETFEQFFNGSCDHMTIKEFREFVKQCAAIPIEREDV